MLSRTPCALVWGARGFIGRHVVEGLLRRRWRVRVLSRASLDPKPAWARDVEWLDTPAAGDRRAALDAAVDGMPVIFNFAGSSGAVASNRFPLESLDSNCRLQLEFLDACARAGQRPHVVFASSRLVYAPADRGAVSETHPVAPRSVYAAHKLCIEHYHRIYAQRGAISYTVCRISNPYGLDEDAARKAYGFVNALIQRALVGDRLTIFGLGLQLRDYVYIPDLVDALCACATRDEARNEVFNLGLGRSLPIAQAAARIQESLGGGPIDFLPWPPDYEAVESGDFVLDVGKARALLGYAPAFDFDGGIADVRARARAAIPVSAAIG